MSTNLMLDDVATVRRTAEWVELRRRTRAEGRASLLWGGLTIAQGIAGFTENPLALPVIGLGLFLIVAGAWAARKPSPQAMHGESIAWWLVVTWNLLFGLLALTAGLLGEAEGFVFALVALGLGALQFRWARQASRRYRRCRELEKDPPPAAAVAELEAMADGLDTSRPADNPQTVEITTPGFGDGGRWRARLAEHWALFVDRTGSALAVATPEELEVADRGERLISHAHRATVRWGGRRIAGTMAPESLARLQAWKAHAALPRSGAAP